MTELQEAIAIAKAILERPNADPDDDLAILARQFLRIIEKEKRVERPRRWKCPWR